MTLASDYLISEFGADDKCWRIDWFGAVSFASRYRRSSQPTIEVQLSYVPGSVASSDDLFERREVQWPRTKQVRLPVGYLPMLKIGDFWKSGRLIEHPEYEKANFANVMIGRDCKLIKAGLPDDDSGSHFIPLDVHPYHLNHTQSFCVQIPYGTMSILVPCIELLRFYFGSSSNLLAKLFDAPFVASNLWSQIDVGGRDSIKIDLAPGISGRSAADIGRIALSADARIAAELVGASCIAATARGERAYPKTLFPFSGETCISANGKWLPKDGQSRGVFLVFNLLSCSHPFPFSKLQYTSGQGHDVRLASRNKAAASGQMLKMKSAKVRVESKTISDTEPSKRLRSRGIGMIFGSMQFPDLARKPVSKIDAENVPSISTTKDGISIFGTFSVGEGGSSPGIHPIDLQILSTSEAASLKARVSDAISVQLFIELIRELSESGKFEKVGIVRLDQSQRSPYLSLTPQISTDDGEIVKYCMITSEIANQTTTRPRRVSVAMTRTLAASIYIFLMEQQDEQIEIVCLLDDAHALAGRDNLLVAFAEQLLKKADEGAHSTYPSLRSLSLTVPIGSCTDLAFVVRWVHESIEDFSSTDKSNYRRHLYTPQLIVNDLSYLQ